MTGPAHFLACRTPTGATLLKHRHLRQLGYALVAVPYWEWDQVRGDEASKVEYVRGKVTNSMCVGEQAAASRCQVAKVDEPRAAPAAQEDQGKPEHQEIPPQKDKSTGKKRKRESSSGATARWTVEYSQKKGRIFYFNRATGESRWKKPQGFE